MVAGILNCGRRVFLRPFLVGGRPGTIGCGEWARRTGDVVLVLSAGWQIKGRRLSTGPRHSPLLIPFRLRIRTRFVIGPYFAKFMTRLHSPSGWGHWPLRWPAARSTMVAALCVAFTACAPLNGKDRHVLEEHRIPGELLQKMLHKEPLSVPEIAQLSVLKVPPEFLVRYIDNSLAEYPLTTSEVLYLKGIGVSHEVIDFMLTTARDRPNAVIITNPYWRPPLYYPPRDRH